MESDSLNAGIAFAAGIASFVSPCILPLIPAYLSLMGGTSLQNLKEQRSLRRVAAVNTLFFIAGFSILFIALGVLFSSTLGLLSGLTTAIDIAAGVVVVFLGLNFIFDFVGFLNFERRFQLQGRPSSKIGSLLFGMAFGAGWSPCVGPILGSILLLAGTSGSVLRGSLLLLIYSLGLGTPFLLTGLFLSRALAQLAKLRRHIGAVKIASGLFLVLIGLLITLGKLKGFNAFAFGLSHSLTLWQKANPLAAQLVVGGIFAVPAVLIALFYLLRLRRELASLPPGRADGGAGALSSALPGVTMVRPFRIGFFVFFAAVAALAFAGVVDLPALFSGWLKFQGL